MIDSRPSAGGPAGLARPTLDGAIKSAGRMGITAKQLAAATSQPIERIQEALALLASESRVARVGRGLWVSSQFAKSPNTDATFLGPLWYLTQFSRQNRLRIGTYSGDIQFNPNERLPVHRWWPYVQGFSARFVEEMCRHFNVGRGGTLLDPFCGSGTVPVVARFVGAKGIGIELMPIAAFVARAKQLWDIDPERLHDAAKTAVVVAKSIEPAPIPFLKETKRQFLPEVLDSLLRLKAAVWKVEDGDLATALRLCLASVLVDSSNLKRAPCLGYTKKLGLTAQTPVQLFLAASRQMESDLTHLQAPGSRWGPTAAIIEADAKSAYLEPASVDLAITSPPYVNGMDYVMNYKLELAWLGLAKSYQDLSSLKSAMVACDNVSHATVDRHVAGAAVSNDRWLGQILKTIRENIRLKSVYRRDDMPGIVAKYFDDLVPVISNVLSALKPGGRFVVVNGDSMIAGTYVPGDLIFSRLATALGFELESLNVARTRRSGQRRDFLLRETILTLRKPGPWPMLRKHASLQATLPDFEPR